MRYCSRCGASRRLGAAFCHQCGHAFQANQSPARRTHAPLVSYEGMHRFAAVMEEQQVWLRRNTLLEPLQRLIDNINLRSDIEEATHLHKAQVLAGHQLYAHEHIEQIVDRVRNARRLAAAEVDLEVESRRLALQDEMNEREHQRSLERLRAQHQHEKEVIELRAHIELTNALIEPFRQLQMIQLEARATGQTQIHQMQMLGEIINHCFDALVEIESGIIDYGRKINNLDIENLEESESFRLVQDLVEALADRIIKGVLEFGKR